MRQTAIMFVMTATLLAGTAYADTPTVTVKEERPGLLQKAKVTAAAATATAQAKVAKGKIVSAEIEEEGGTLVFSFDIKTKGKTGIDEVVVDATSGNVVSVTHETPSGEAKEQAQDAKKRK